MGAAGGRIGRDEAKNTGDALDSNPPRRLYTDLRKSAALLCAAAYGPG